MTLARGLWVTVDRHHRVLDYYYYAVVAVVVVVDGGGDDDETLWMPVMTMTMMTKRCRASSSSW